jgi:hypothetical protein
MILKLRWTCAFMVLGLLVAIQSFAAEPLESLINKGSHQELQDFYSQQAKEFKAKADYWDLAAEFYERHPGEPTGDLTRAQHIAHCQAISETFRKAAHEARNLATEHYDLTRKGP